MQSLVTLVLMSVGFNSGYKSRSTHSLVIRESPRHILIFPWVSQWAISVAYIFSGCWIWHISTSKRPKTFESLKSNWEQSNDCNLLLLQTWAIFGSPQSRQFLESWVYHSASIDFIPPLKNFLMFLYIFLHRHTHKNTQACTAIRNNFLNYTI